MKTKKKLIVPIAMLVLAVMAITSTTFAWFTTNSTVNASITNAKVINDGTMLFIVDESAGSNYTTAYNSVNWTQVYQDGYDAWVADPFGGNGTAPVVGSGSAAELDAIAAGNDAVKAKQDELLAMGAHWGFSTSKDYEFEALEMIDLTYTRDSDHTRYNINKGKDPYAEALKLLDKETYMEAYNLSYHGVTSNTSETIVPGDGTSTIAMTGKVAADAALVSVGGTLTYGPAGISNIGITVDALKASQTLAYDKAYLVEYYNQWQKAFAMYKADPLYVGSTDDNIAALVNVTVMNEALPANDPDYSAMTAAYKAIKDAAHDAAHDAAMIPAITAVEATKTESDKVWYTEYNDVYGFVVIDTGINTVLRGTHADGYEGAYGDKYKEVMIVLDGYDYEPSTEYSNLDNLYDLHRSDDPRRIAKAEAEAAIYAAAEATAAADLAVDSIAGTIGERATTNKINTAKTDAAYSQYGIFDGKEIPAGTPDAFDSFEHGLYSKKIFNTTDDRMVAEATATQNEDYIDLTYTFWCEEPTDSATATNKLALDVGAPGYIASYITSQLKNEALKFNTKDLAYFLEQGRKDQRVAEFYGIKMESTGGPYTYAYTNDIVPAPITEAYATIIADVDASTGGAVAGISETYKAIKIGADYYIFNVVSGQYTSNAANAARVMFTEIDQTGAGNDNIIGIWDPNPDAGYDAKDVNGDRIQTLDVQDMYNKAQTGYAGFSNLKPNDYVDRYNENTDQKLLEVSNDYDIELLDFKKQVVSADGFYRAQLNVKIWLEGFDSDCFNVIFGDILDVNLQFKAFTGV